MEADTTTVQRQGLMYDLYIDRLLRCLAHDAGSILDAGSHDLGYLHTLEWISDKVALEPRQLKSSGAKLSADLFRLDTSRTYDFLTCFHVLERIHEPARFAHRLMKLSRRVLISVPYEWPAGTAPDHVNDPIDLETVTAWFDRRPNYSIVVQEPLHALKRARRLIAYFHSGSQMPTYEILRKAAR